MQKSRKSSMFLTNRPQEIDLQLSNVSSYVYVNWSHALSHWLRTYLRATSSDDLPFVFFCRYVVVCVLQLRRLRNSWKCLLLTIRGVFVEYLAVEVASCIFIELLRLRCHHQILNPPTALKIATEGLKLSAKESER